MRESRFGYRESWPPEDVHPHMSLSTGFFFLSSCSLVLVLLLFRGIMSCPHVVLLRRCDRSQKLPAFFSLRLLAKLQRRPGPLALSEQSPPRRRTVYPDVPTLSRVQPVHEENGRNGVERMGGMAALDGFAHIPGCSTAPYLPQAPLPQHTGTAEVEPERHHSDETIRRCPHAKGTTEIASRSCPLVTSLCVVGTSCSCTFWGKTCDGETQGRRATMISARSLPCSSLVKIQRA